MKLNPYENVKNRINSIANNIATKINTKTPTKKKNLKKLMSIVEKFGNHRIKNTQMKSSDEQKIKQKI